MKASVFLINIIFVCSMLSCQKKVDWLVDPVTKEVLDSTQNQANASEVLTSIVAVTGNEILETNFKYDSSKYLQSELLEGSENGLPVSRYKKYYRDTLGKIIKIAAKEKQQSDSIFTSVIYDDYYAKTVLYTLSIIKVQSTTVWDSVVFVYDGNGHIGIQKSYSQKPNSSYHLYQQQEYTYAGNNLVKARQFVDSSNTAILILASEYHYLYDTRLNPLQLRNEAFLTGSPERASLNNLISTDLDNKMFPADNYKVESKLLYSNTRKPVYSTSVKSPSGRVSVVTYLYK